MLQERQEPMAEKLYVEEEARIIMYQLMKCKYCGEEFHAKINANLHLKKHFDVIFEILVQRSEAKS